MPDPTEADKARAAANMRETFGKIGNDMSKQELTAIFQDVINGKRNDEFFRFLQGEQTPAYSLVGLPIVYHVLTQQHIPKSNSTLDAVRPSATTAQIAFTTDKTNDFSIYIAGNRRQVYSGHHSHTVRQSIMVISSSTKTATVSPMPNTPTSSKMYQSGSTNCMPSFANP
jgi:hypothetical protein